MKNVKNFSFGIAMLVSFLSFGQEINKKTKFKEKEFFVLDKEFENYNDIFLYEHLCY